MDNLMKPVESVKQISMLRQKVKSINGNVVSNYTVFPFDAERWIDASELFYMDSGSDSSVFLLHKGSRIYELFFFSTDYEEMTNSIDNLLLPSDMSVTLEILSRDSGFSIHKKPLMILSRMYSNKIPQNLKMSVWRTAAAVEEDLFDIEQILLQSFNPIAERIPNLNELRCLSKSIVPGIHVVKNNGKIVGLVIFSVDKGTLHLRYWWTDSSYRGQGVGGSLLNTFFQNGKECKRMILWVDIHNDNAIQKYEHYGFYREQMFDYIYQI